MKTYVESEESMVPPGELKIFLEIKEGVNSLPNDLDLGKAKVRGRMRKVDLSCHILATAVWQMYPLYLKIVDGQYGHVEHSWLVMKSGNIVDVYPVGVVGGPLLICSVGNNPQMSPYCPMRNSAVYEFSKRWFTKAVDITLINLKGSNHSR